MTSSCDVMVRGLKKDYYAEPIFTDNEQFFFNGTNTKAHCDTFWQTVVAKPIDVQELLVNEQLIGNFGPDDLLLKRPKMQALKTEAFHGNVAVNQYGVDHSWIMQVDNDHLLSSPKIDSFAVNQTAPDLKKTPNITSDLTNLLKNPLKVNVQGKVIGTDKTVTIPMFKSNFRSKLKFTADSTPLPENKTATTSISQTMFRNKQSRTVDGVDVSLLKKAAKKNISKRAFQDRVARLIETLAVKSKDPHMSKDVEKLLRDNLDIINQVVAFGQKDPKYQLVIERLTRDHLDIMRIGMESTGFKKGKAFGQSLSSLLKEKNDITFSVPFASMSEKGDFVKGVTPTCFLDDRFVSRDQLGERSTYAAPPGPSIATLPISNRCHKFQM